jgi:hypothetical protein
LGQNEVELCARGLFEFVAARMESRGEAPPVRAWGLLSAEARDSWLGAVEDRARGGRPSADVVYETVLVALLRVAGWPTKLDPASPATPERST